VECLLLPSARNSLHRVTATPSTRAHAATPFARSCYLRRASRHCSFRSSQLPAPAPPQQLAASVCATLPLVPAAYIDVHSGHPARPWPGGPTLLLVASLVSVAGPAGCFRVVPTRHSPALGSGHGRAGSGEDGV
jgi:hypothetical protein